MRLEARVTFWLLTLFGAAGAVTLVGMARFQRESVERQFEMAGTAVALAVENSLEVGMLNNSLRDIYQAVQDVRRGTTITAVAVYRRDGSSWVGSPQGSLLGPRARQALADSLATARTAAASEEGTLTVFVPVVNQARCSRCHPGAQGEVLGAVGVGLDESPLARELQAVTRKSLYAAAVPLGLGLVASLWAVRKTLLQPLVLLAEAAHRLAAGEFSVRLPAFGAWELNAVSSAFNDMARKLQLQAQDLSRTVEQLRSDLEGLEALHSLLTSGAGLPEILRGAAAHLASAVGASGVAIWRAGSELPEAVWGERLPPVQAAAGWQGHASSAGPGWPPQGEVEWVLIPAGRRGRTLALVGVVWDPPRALGREETELLSSLVGIVAVAVENAELLERLREKEVSLEAVLKKTLAAQEEERRRVARELHDETSQILSALIMNIDVLSTQVPCPEPMRARLEAVKSLAEEAVRNLDQVMMDLRPALLDELGLFAALRWYVSQVREAWGLEVEFRAEGAKRLPEHVEVAAFRIAQEAISNAVRHARASKVSVRVAAGEGKVRVEVEDNGVGFDVGQVMSRARLGESAGIVGMKERAELLGGWLKVESAVGEGTRVLAEIPLGVEG